MDRFTISLDEGLAAEFDHWIAQRGYANRSEAFRDLLRAELERTRLERGQATHCIACLSYVFNHHERDLSERLTGLQHDHHDLTISTMHAHIDHENCLETVILHGSTAAVVAFADRVCAERGVRHGKLNLISVERDDHHSHRHPGAGRGAKGEPHVHFKPAS